MDYLTSDTHWGHYNIIRYSKRPFASIEEMNQTLIDNINILVKPDDRLFHLGDFAKSRVEYFRKAIKCKNVFLISGNHDRLKKWEEDLFSGVADLKTLTTDVNGETKQIVLFHYAMRVWNKSHYGVCHACGSYNFMECDSVDCHAYGHSHGSLPDDPNSLSMDVGVDSIAQKLSPDGIIRRPEDYRPISVVEFFEYMKLKTWKPVDHHGSKEDL